MGLEYEQALAELSKKGRLRSLGPRSGLDFTSNDYLALADSAELRRAAEEALARGVPLGAGGSRLLRGNHPEHEALEAEAASFFRSETALFFGAGFSANSAIFATLPQRGDLVVHDALIHASVHDGMRAGRAACAAAAHNDAAAFDHAIRRWRAEGGKGRPWIAVESLYSMDGDRAPLADLMQVAERHDGILVIDEAHATGVFGPDGRGLGSAFEGHRDVISLHTCGKALGVMGALLCAPRELRDFLVNRSRAFIYSTAPSPLIAALVRASLGLCRTEPTRRARLLQLVAHAGDELQKRCDIATSGSHIIPVVVHTDARAIALARALGARGFDVRPIRPPTVPEGTARLRIALTLHADKRTVTRLIGALAEELAVLHP